MKRRRSSSSSSEDIPLITIKYYKYEVINKETLLRPSEEQCEICLKHFDNKYSYLLHNAGHIIIPLIKTEFKQCLICLKLFMSKDDLNNHTKDYHNKQVINEEDVDYSISRLNDKKECDSNNKFHELITINKDGIHKQSKGLENNLQNNNSKGNNSNNDEIKGNVSNVKTYISVRKNLFYDDKDAQDCNKKAKITCNPILANLLQKRSIKTENLAEPEEMRMSDSIRNRIVFEDDATELPSSLLKDIVDECKDAIDLIEPSWLLNSLTDDNFHTDVQNGVQHNSVSTHDLKSTADFADDSCLKKDKCVSKVMSNPILVNLLTNGRPGNAVLDNSKMENSIDSTYIQNLCKNSLNNEVIVGHNQDTSILTIDLTQVPDELNKEGNPSQSQSNIVQSQQNSCRTGENFVEYQRDEFVDWTGTAVGYDELVSPGIYKCKRCCKIYPNRLKLLKHEPTHMFFDNSKPDPCYYCERYVLREAMAGHCALYHRSNSVIPGVTPKKCRICGLNTFNWSLHYNLYHNSEVKKTESKNKPLYLCNKCYTEMRPNFQEHRWMVYLGDCEQCKRCKRRPVEKEIFDWSRKPLEHRLHVIRKKLKRLSRR